VNSDFQPLSKGMVSALERGIDRTGEVRPGKKD